MLEFGVLPIDTISVLKARDARMVTVNINISVRMYTMNTTKALYLRVTLSLSVLLSTSKMDMASVVCRG